MRLHVSSDIQLAEFRRSDESALIEYLNDRRVYECTLRIPHPYKAADAEFWFNLVEQHAGHDLPINWAIRNGADELIGGIGLESRPGPHQHRAEIGYWLARPLWGHGIMTEVVRTVCRHAFAHLALEKITAHVFTFNAASARVLEKCGFQREGLLRKHYLKDGQYIDVVVYGLLRDDARGASTG